ncbi:MAG: potassium transporter Trk [Rhodoglobus sp.]
MSDPERSEVRIRRAPKLGIFLLLGAVVGALVTLVLTSLFTPDPAIGFAASFGYFLLFGAPAGAALGAIVGLIIDRVSVARARTVTVEREVVGEENVAPGE